MEGVSNETLSRRELHFDVNFHRKPLTGTQDSLLATSYGKLNESSSVHPRGLCDEIFSGL